MKQISSKKKHIDSKNESQLFSTQTHQLVRKIRDLINEGWKSNQYLYENRNISGWHMLCSAMDTIEDTDLAQKAYLSLINEDKSIGEKYLIYMEYFKCYIINQTQSSH